MPLPPLVDVDTFAKWPGVVVDLDADDEDNLDIDQAEALLAYGSALARDEATRNRRREVVVQAARLTSLGACMKAASNLVSVTKEEADAVTSELDAKEKAHELLAEADRQARRRIGRQVDGDARLAQPRQQPRRAEPVQQGHGRQVQ